MAATITTTLTISTSTAALPSPPPPAKGALRRPTPMSPASSSSTASAKKSASFSPDLARDLQTGEIVPPQSTTGAQYRAWFRERRQVEQRRQSVREQAERDFDSAMKRLVFVVAHSSSL
ncbi:hypothetical protein PG999_006053 [Apiospora kogelbergensis]|uniref:Uncharacterized protein n=1 Tax=Apiospora kogelbergensis TaxID=1337665 RepID=A0AAW0QVA0_9PEZI